MRVFLVFCFVVVAAAAPQGYNYQQPIHQQPQVSAPAPAYNAAPAPAYNAAPAPAYNAAPAPAYNAAPAPAYNAGPAPAYNQAQAYNQGPAIGHVGGAAATTQFGQQVQHQQAPAVVTKNFYIHSAPEETEEEALSQSLGGGPARKNYRVVFIKAPAQSSSAAALQLAQSQNEEKTVIYVLSKKTDAAELQAGLETAHATPSKPEVFFIKYKTPEEAEHAQHQIQAQYDSLGGGPTHVSDEGIAPVQSFIGALGDSGSAHAHHGAQGAQAGGSIGGAIGGSIGASSAIGGSAGASNQYLPPAYY